MRFIIAIACAALVFITANTQKCSVDIAILVDESSSITPVNYEKKVVPFLVSLISGLNISPSGDHIAFVPFSDPEVTAVEFFFNKYTKKQDALVAVINQQFLAGNTATTKAFELTRTEVFQESNGARRSQYNKNVAPVVLIITDGVASDGDAAAASAKLRAEVGASVFAVGVGSLLSKEFLVKITGDASHVFPVEKFQDLSLELAQTVLKSTTGCKA